MFDLNRMSVQLRLVISAALIMLGLGWAINLMVSEDVIKKMMMAFSVIACGVAVLCLGVFFLIGSKMHQQFLSPNANKQLIENYFRPRMLLSALIGSAALGTVTIHWMFALISSITFGLSMFWLSFWGDPSKPAKSKARFELPVFLLGLALIGSAWSLKMSPTLGWVLAAGLLVPTIRLCSTSVKRFERDCEGDTADDRVHLPNQKRFNPYKEGDNVQKIC